MLQFIENWLWTTNDIQEAVRRGKKVDEKDCIEVGFIQKSKSTTRTEMREYRLQFEKEKYARRYFEEFATGNI